MTDTLIVLTTIDEEHLAEKIGTTLVERRLAACVNVISMGITIYRWQERICRDREYMLLIKTSAHLFDEVCDTIGQLHTYRLPEVIALPIAVGDERVMDWITASVKARP